MYAPMYTGCTRAARFEWYGTMYCQGYVERYVLMYVFRVVSSRTNTVA